MSIMKMVGIGAAAGFLVAGLALAGTVLDQTVKITDKGYTPAEVDVKVGHKVIFQNTTQKDHTVTSKNPAGAALEDGFDSGVIKPGTSWEHTFSKKGTFPYTCKEDKTMTGTVVVTAEK